MASSSVIFCIIYITVTTFSGQIQILCSETSSQICRLLCFASHILPSLPLMTFPSNPYLIRAGNVIFLFHSLHGYTWGRSKKYCLCLEEKLHLPSKGSGQRTRRGLSCTALKPKAAQPSSYSLVPRLYYRCRGVAYE